MWTPAVFILTSILAVRWTTWRSKGNCPYLVMMKSRWLSIGVWWSRRVCHDTSGVMNTVSVHAASLTLLMLRWKTRCIKYTTLLRTYHSYGSYYQAHWLPYHIHQSTLIYWTRTAGCLKIVFVHFITSAQQRWIISELLFSLSCLIYCF